MRIVSPTPPDRGWTYASHSYWSKVFNFPTLAGAGGLAIGGRYVIGAPYGDLKIAAWVVIGLAIGAVFFRGLRIGVWANPERVVVQNFWRTYEFAWSDVVRVRAELEYRSRRWVFEFQDGRKISASGCPMIMAGSATEELTAVPQTPGRPPVDAVVDGRPLREEF